MDDVNVTSTNELGCGFKVSIAYLHISSGR